MIWDTEMWVRSETIRYGHLISMPSPVTGSNWPITSPPPASVPPAGRPCLPGGFLSGRVCLTLEIYRFVTPPPPIFFLGGGVKLKKTTTPIRGLIFTVIFKSKIYDFYHYFFVGMFPDGRIAVNIFAANGVGLPTSETTLAEVAKTVGYKTALVGKYRLQ